MLLQQENTLEPRLYSSNRKKNNIRVITPDIWASQLSWSLTGSVPIELTEGQYHNSSLSELTWDSIEGKVRRKCNPPLITISDFLWAAKMRKVVIPHRYNEAPAALAAGTCAIGASQPLENHIGPELRGCWPPPPPACIVLALGQRQGESQVSVSDSNTVLLLRRKEPSKILSCCSVRL